MDVSDGSALTDGLRFASFQSHAFGKAENGLATGEGELVDQLECVWVAAVVFDLSFYEHAVASDIIPDMHAEGLYANVIGLDE